jgi:hypothetical protein
MIARCPKLQERWREATHTEITGGLKAEILSDGSVSGTGLCRTWWVYSIKRTGLTEMQSCIGWE